MTKNVRDGEMPIDFIVIGAMKAGTTRLYARLQHDPRIILSSIKEPHYFSFRAGRQNWGPEWYDSLFPRRSGLRGEASTSYSKVHRIAHVAERIYAVNPRVKIIYLVRNPIDRAISHYLHRALGGRESRAIHTAIFERPSDYVDTGRYSMQLRPYRERFPDEQLFVYQAETFWTRERESLLKLYSFLGLRLPDHNREQKARRNSLLFHVTRFLQRDSDVESYGEAQILLNEVLQRTEQRKLTSEGLACLLGFTAVDRERLWALYRSDVEELEKSYPGISNGWDL